MALVEVPVFPADFCFVERAVFDGTPYQLQGHFNTRMNRWVLDVKDENGNDLVLGLVLVPDWQLADGLKGRVAGFWRGQLFTLDTTGRGRAADLETLGKDVKLYYFEAQYGAQP